MPRCSPGGSRLPASHTSPAAGPAGRGTAVRSGAATISQPIPAVAAWPACPIRVPAQALTLTTVTTATPPGGFVHLVVGYDGSAPAGRALDAAVRLLQGRTGRIDVVYVAQLSSFAMLSPGAIAEIESDFDEIEQELRTAAAEQLGDSGAAWEFQRRQGIVADELLAAATTLRDADPGGTVAIVVGSSSHATHRVIGSVAVSLARHSPVPLVIVP